ncbi:DUF3179 domain-containing (seleno)protein [Flavitalea sp. BT771]|uniref:DUF3179 domain-containing (seleno)protein n=1 Tax=Flavitalea sp. BT771 TaxID=3063329 RepID=UPI0026E3F721|nr:DUF3179 domain-containing (seleno)protein [Flavitalea sp. BT771]MDO6429323.1 DUF3179 domain-containing (seleno)protein [Flavitalea sp. BT771]MDV6218549.1 DUF3179 domain-containing (seleno)protein [Flavitalea sp. BT771]
MKRLLLFTGIIILFATEILRVYFIMPFPGSQHRNTIDLAYFIHRNRLFLRLLGLLLVIVPLYRSLVKGKTWSRILLTMVMVLYAVVFYFFNFRFEADKMFYQPGTIRFADAATNTIPLNKLVIGVTINDASKAYPVQVIGYHHQVRDTVGNTPVMITYCTVCRTGRVFSPLVNGRSETFRLVGMDHFNAMFEDATTKSWWQQATGVSIAGPLKSQRLAEIPSSQSSLSDWIAQHPDTKILQPDTVYKKQYEDLADYDKGTIKGSLEKRDSGSWKMKSWVVGIATKDHTKAYDWNDLIRHQLIQDTVGDTPVLLLPGTDSTTFYVWNRNLKGQVLQFERLPGSATIKDGNTGSTWTLNGKCTAGTLKDQQLQAVQSYQEFWHSWSNFHPGTTRYRDPNALEK